MNDGPSLITAEETLLREDDPFQTMFELDPIDEAELLQMDYTETNTNQANITNANIEQHTISRPPNDNNETRQESDDNILFDMTNLNDSILELRTLNTQQPAANDNEGTGTHSHDFTNHQETIGPGATENGNGHDNDDSNDAQYNITDSNENHLIAISTNHLHENNENDTNLPTPVINEPTDNVNTQTPTINENDIEISNAPTQTNDQNEQLNHNETLPDLTDIPLNLREPFKILYTLKHKRDKQQTTIDNLNEHHMMNTTPIGLKVKHTSTIHLPPQFRERWERTLDNASNELLKIILDYQQFALKDTNMKIQHRTQHILDHTNDQQLANQIINKTNEIGEKYTKRAIISTIKSTKKHKRRRHRPNTPRHHPYEHNQTNDSNNTEQHHNQNPTVLPTTPLPSIQNNYPTNMTHLPQTAIPIQQRQYTSPFTLPTPRYFLPNHTYPHGPPTHTITRPNLIRPTITQHIEQGIQDFLYRHMHQQPPPLQR